jgi:hypothetical protein
MTICKTVVVVHGKSELILCRNISSNLRIQIEPYSKNSGNESIKIVHLKDLLCDGDFKDEYTLHKKYSKLEYLPKKPQKMPNLKIYTIIDIDGCPRQRRSYETKDIFKDSVFYDRITPIYNDDNLDIVMELCGFGKVGPNKTEYYQNLTKNINLFEFRDKLTECKNTNMEEFIDYCISIAPNYKTKNH